MQKGVPSFPVNRSNQWGSVVSYKNLVFGLGAAAVVLVVACSSANFGGTTAAPSKTDDGNKSTTGGDPNNDPTKKPGSGGIDDPGPAKCANDQVKLKLSTEEEKCIVEQGKTWDFSKKQCASLPKAEFQCNWTELVAKLSSHAQSLVTETIKKSSTDGSKLVSCGQGVQVLDPQTNKRYIRYAVQFISAATGGKQVECEGTPSNELSITTGCYTFADNGAPQITIPPSTDKVAYENYVYNCINNLAPTP